MKGVSLKIETKDMEEVIASVVFASGEAIEISLLAEKLGLTEAKIRKYVDKLKAKYSGTSGVQLMEFRGKLQFASNPAYQDEITAVLSEIKEKNVSRASLEVLSIIAYKQPITRLEVEEIRGVSSDYSIDILLDNKLIEVVGRKDSIGKPLLFGTTDEFLKRFNLTSLADLPDYGELIERIKVIKTEAQADSLYNEFEIKDEEIPEFLIGEEVKTITSEN